MNINTDLTYDSFKYDKVENPKEIHDTKNNEENNLNYSPTDIKSNVDYNKELDLNVYKRIRQDLVLSQYPADDILRLKEYLNKL